MVSTRGFFQGGVAEGLTSGFEAASVDTARRAGAKLGRDQLENERQKQAAAAAKQIQEDLATALDAVTQVAAKKGITDPAELSPALGTMVARVLSNLEAAGGPAISVEQALAEAVAQAIGPVEAGAAEGAQARAKFDVQLPGATDAQRAAALGAQPRVTPQQEISEIQAARGAPLSSAQVDQALGVAQPEQPKAQSPQGKVLQDRELFTRQFGTDSPQVQAFDEATSAEGAPSLAEEGGIRKEFTKLSGDFVKIRDSFNRIAAVSQDPSAAGDLALIFNFMKMLDPGSTVREGEFATAQNSAGVPERAIAAYNRLLSGERMAPEQRADFLAQSEALMRSQLVTQMRLEDTFKLIAESAKVKDPTVVVPDFVGPFRDAFGGVGSAPLNGGSVMKFDLQGNRIKAE